MNTQHFDVIIIGGRPAGASLAMRLGQQGLKTLLVDKATFPSLPAVPSSPVIHIGTMNLLDELGLAESDYAYPAGKITQYTMNYINHFTAQIPVSVARLNRSHYYGIDRNRFDTALWDRAAAQPTVTAYSGFTVTQINKDAEGRVIGISGKCDNGSEATYTSDLVVGADGRFSFAARKFGAEVTEERNEHVSASYHAEWENVEPPPECKTALSVYNFANGFFVLTIPIDERKYIVGIYTRAEDAHYGQNLEAEYLKLVHSVPELAARLRNARQVTRVVGVRPIQNGYRQGFGVGWALVGDAMHYKDAIDGQGIYDALLGAKILAEAIDGWKQHGMTWEEAGEIYQERVMDESHPMFVQTVARVKQEIFTTPPVFILRTLIRWMMTDPEFQHMFVRYSSRAMNPSDFNPAPNPGIILRGIGRDIQARFFGAKPVQPRATQTIPAV
jgi:2-polyprenyl-6-methoxyphenol hydroxylase-like FAD-dependent oxidoreductase